MDAELQKIVEKLEQALPNINHANADWLVKEALAELRSYEHPVERTMKKARLELINGERALYWTGELWRTQSSTYGSQYKDHLDLSSALVALIGKEGE